MKACIMTAAGGPEVLEVKEVPEPVAGYGEVLVAIKAASVNPIDTKIRALDPPFGPGVQNVLGCDMAGIIEVVGAGVTGFQVGDTVYGSPGGVKGTGGTYGEKIVCDPSLLAKKPANLDFREAAALPLVFITAYEALVDRAKISAGQHVLIHGGAGGVGHVAIQIAKAYGARVATTVSSQAKADLVTSLGADDVIFYRDETVAEYVARLTGGKGFDLVFDCTGGSDLPVSFEAARPLGQVMTIVARYSADLSLMHSKGLTLHVIFMLIPLLSGEGRAHHGEILRELSSRVEAGEVKPLLDDSRFSLTEISAAHTRLEAGEATGKIIIDTA